MLIRLESYANLLIKGQFPILAPHLKKFICGSEIALSLLGGFMRWFKHDTDALRDAKIEKLIMKYGIEGYGLYFACVEIIAGSLTNEKITFELEHDAEILAYKFKIDSIQVEEMMKYMVKLGLFETHDNRIFCYKLASRIDSSMIKNPELLKIKKGIQENSRSFKKEQEKSLQIRLDKNRLEDKKEKKERFKKPSLLEVSDYISEKGYSVNADAFVNFYESKNWFVGKNKMANWQAAIRTWENKNNAPDERKKEIKKYIEGME